MPGINLPAYRNICSMSSINFPPNRNIHSKIATKLSGFLPYVIQGRNPDNFLVAILENLKIQNEYNVWFKKTGTIRSSNTLLRIVPVFLNQTLYSFWINLTFKKEPKSDHCLSTFITYLQFFWQYYYIEKNKSKNLKILLPTLPPLRCRRCATATALLPRPTSKYY
jgi:hypothetical protein